MDDKYIWILISSILLILMLLGNRKARLIKIICEQLKVFKNAKTDRISLWDFSCFVLFPILLATISVFKLEITISSDLAELFTTVFSIIFTVLLGFTAILIGKIDSAKNLEKKVAEETFVSVISSTILSLSAGVLSIVLIQINNLIIQQVISTIIFSISFMIVMLLLLITKRTFLLYVNNK